MKKRLISVFLVLVMLLCAASASVFASDEPELVTGDGALVPVEDEPLSSVEEAVETATEPTVEDGESEEPLESEDGSIFLELDGMTADSGDLSTDGGSSSYFKEADVLDAIDSVRAHFVAHDQAFVINMTMYDRPSDMTNAKLKSIIEPLAERLIEDAMVHNGTPNAGDYLLWGIKSAGIVNVNYSPTSGSTTAVLTLTASASYYTSADQEKTVATKISNILSSLNLEGKTDYKKVEAIHDWICDNVSYDLGTYNKKTGYNEYDDLSFTAYKALVLHKSVCQGYSTLFYRMCLEAGIDCRIVAGTAYTEDFPGGQPHSWNMVKLGDRYYYVDATWDAPQMSFGLGHMYFCKGYTFFADTYKLHTFNDYSGADSLNKINYKGFVTKDSKTMQWTNFGVTYLIAKEDFDPDAHVCAFDTYVNNGDNEIATCSCGKTDTTKTRSHKWSSTWTKLDENSEQCACETCTATKTRSHKWSSTWTKLDENSEQCACETCTATKTRGHSMGGWTVTAEPTKDHSGTRACRCSTCSHTLEESIAWVLGDFNNNGKVDAADIVCFAKYIAGDTSAVTNVPKGCLSGGADITLIDLVKAMKAAAAS